MSYNMTDSRPVDEILSKPIAEDTLERLMIANAFIKGVTRDNFDRIADYILAPQFSEEFSTYVMLYITGDNPSYCELPGFVKWARAHKTMRL